MAASITHFISSEVGNPAWALCRHGSIATIRQRASIAAMYVETVVYVTVKIVTSVKPWTRANEDAIRKPFRTVVAEGSAGIRRVVVVAIRAVGSDTDADADGNLSFCFGRGRRSKADSGKNGHGKTLKSVHDILLTVSDQCSCSTWPRQFAVTQRIAFSRSSSTSCETDSFLTIFLFSRRAIARRPPSAVIVDTRWYWLPATNHHKILILPALWFSDFHWKPIMSSLPHCRHRAAVAQRFVKHISTPRET
jgi:hypothetical protein